ncbi:MAG: phosphate ABC transporter substrate-binding protein PstS [Armatimonadota bacterium]|nr:phosphate ABC transporter substrate-binding protein PstS [bacterium]MDW8321032.1 phosphate ABC transporter substrate-binding protein PstS [Armatimonadota bacterium]
MRQRSMSIVAGVLVATALAIVAGCAPKKGTTTTGSETKVQITGAGSTFVNPIMSRWSSEYEKLTGVQVNYQSIGSGGGIQQFKEGTIDFGATDVAVTAEEQKDFTRQFVQFPVVAGTVAVVYNLPGVTQNLQLSPEVLADIFLGKIKKWNDRRLAELNPGVNLPDQDIVVVHRSDGSGTTYIFTDYLSTVSTEWQQRVGRGKSVSWPVGVGGKGNEGVTGQVKQLPGAVGYVELNYAVQNNLTFAAIRNAAGKFVLPGKSTGEEATRMAVEKLKQDIGSSVVNMPGENSYPITGFVYVLVDKQPKDAAKSAEMKKFFEWVLRDGQKMAVELDYVPLAEEVAQMSLQKLAEVP